jgi:hypothetical protein
MSRPKTDTRLEEIADITGIGKTQVSEIGQALTGLNIDEEVLERAKEMRAERADTKRAQRTTLLREPA